MSTIQSKKQTKILGSVYAVLLFFFLFVLILFFNYDIKIIGFKEVDAYISNYSVMGKLSKKYVSFKDDYGNEYRSNYVCENGTKTLNSKVKLSIREERLTIPYLYDKHFNNVLNGDVVACNPS